MEIVTSWIEQGIERGIEQGIEQGVEQGIEQGRQETQAAIALNLIRKSLPLETIAEVTGLTLAQLQQLQVDDSQV